nr:metastasis-suppressor KiSS-1 isoform X1 [Oryctolagus cuniculus]
MSSLNLDHWLGELGGLQEATPTPLPSTDSDCPSPEGRTGLSTSSQSQLGRLQGLWAQTSGPRDSRLGRTSQPRPVFVGGNTKIKSPSASGHRQGLPHLTRMNALVSWQLLLFLCATSFRESLGGAAVVESPGPTDQRLGAPGLRRALETKPAPARLTLRAAPPCPDAGSPCAPRSRLAPAPRDAVLVQRERDSSAYNWNSFGLRYGKRGAALGRGGVGAGRC